MILHPKTRPVSAEKVYDRPRDGAGVQRKVDCVDRAVSSRRYPRRFAERVSLGVERKRRLLPQEAQTHRRAVFLRDNVLTLHPGWV